MSWTYLDFENWISKGCPKEGVETVVILDLVNIGLTTLPGWVAG